MGEEANDLKIFQDLQQQKTDLYRSMDKCFAQVKNNVGGQNLYNDVLSAAEEFEKNILKVLFIGTSEELKEMYQSNFETGGNDQVSFSFKHFEEDPLQYVINYKEYPDIVVSDNNPEAYEKIRRRFMHSQIFVVGQHEDDLAKEEKLEDELEKSEEINAEANLGETLEGQSSENNPGEEIMELAAKDPDDVEEVPLTDRERRRLERMKRRSSEQIETEKPDSENQVLTDRERRRLEREKSRAERNNKKEVSVDDKSENGLTDRERRRLERRKRKAEQSLENTNDNKEESDDSNLSDRERRRLERQKAREEKNKIASESTNTENSLEKETPVEKQALKQETDVIEEKEEETPQPEIISQVEAQEPSNPIEEEPEVIDNEEKPEQGERKNQEKSKDRSRRRERGERKDRGDRTDRSNRRDRGERRSGNSDQSTEETSNQNLEDKVAAIPIPANDPKAKKRSSSSKSRVEERRARKVDRSERPARESTSERLRASERRERDLVQPETKNVLDLNVDPKEIKIPKSKYLASNTLFKDFISSDNIRDSKFILKSFYSNKIGQISKLMEFFVKSKNVEEKRTKGKMILNNKDLSEIRSTDTRGISRESSNIKGDLSKKIRILQRQFESELDKVQFDETGFVQSLKNEIKDYQGLLEVEAGKTITIDISDGYAKDLEKKAKKGLSEFVEGTARTIITNITSIQNELKNYLKEKKIDGPIIPKVSLSDMPTEDYCTLEPIQTSSLTKSFSKKGGMYQLFMELRTPMFMMMPLMMVGSLFGALLVGSDNGAISPITNDAYGEQIVKIDRFPEYFAQNGTKSFVASFEEVVQKKGREGNYFIGNWSSSGERRNKETFELNYKEEGESVILFVSDSRDKAVKQLTNFYDSKLGGGKRVSMGYSAIFGIISKYSQFRYYIFGALMLAIFMFSKKKIKEQALEKEVSLEKERSSIKSSLSQGLERGVSMQISSWKGFISDFLKTKQDMLVGITEKLVDKKVEAATYDVNNKKKIIDQRQKNFQKEQKSQADLIKSLEQIVNDLKPMEKHLFKK